MDLDYAKSLSYTSIRKLFKSHLQSLELGKNTVNTVTGDSFYLWNNESKSVFWDVVLAEDFEKTAREVLLKSLTAHSSGNAPALLNGYVSSLRRFKSFVYEENESLVPEKDDLTALKDFLLDIDCLDPLDEWTSKFNLFDILKISRVEIRHSNMLSWLLNPNENHGLGESVIRGFIQYVVTSFSDDSDIFTTLLMDCHDFIIQREWHNIDLLAVSASEKFILCIENKIDSGEHDNQLNRYKKIVEDTYPGYRKMYIFLSPEGIESSDPDNWCSMSYQDVVNIVENSRRKVKLLPEAELLIQNYIDTIRRDIVGDEKLAQICAEIYAKHQKALDLIFENRPDRASDLAAIILAWAKEKTANGDIEVVPEKSSKSATRFKTQLMSELMPDSADTLSGWGTPNYYFYEIKNNEGKEFFIQLSFSSKDIPDSLRDMCDRIVELHPTRQKKQNWQWRTPISTKHSKVDDELSEDKIFEMLDKKLSEIKSFEENLKKQISEEM